MLKRHWLIALVLMCVVVQISTAAEVKKKKSSVKKKSGKSSKTSRLKNSRVKPQADVPIPNGDDFEEDYDYDYDLGMKNVQCAPMFGLSLLNFVKGNGNFDDTEETTEVFLRRDDVHSTGKILDVISLICLACY